MKKYLGILLVLLLILGGILFYQSNEVSTVSPKEAIEQGIKQLRASGQIKSDQEDLLRVQLAVADYIANHFEPPDSLETLIPRYFDTLPLDPKTKKTIHYLKKGIDFELGTIDTDLIEPAKSEEEKGSGVAIEYINPNTVEIEEFVYDPSGKRDPFQPFDFSPKVEIDESLPPLQRYEVSQLRTAAILTDTNGERFAMIEDATGRGYPVRVGHLVGNKNGKVVSIDENQVNILESATDFTGETKQDLVTIKLDTAGSSKGKSRKGR
jgi:Tfp pilus assembly protein PilP